MNQEERLEYLIRYLVNESATYKDLYYAPSEAPRILRSLMNLRMPSPVSQEFLDTQDAYLKEKSRHHGSVELDTIPTVQESCHSSHRFTDRISIWQRDVTRLKVDAIVDAANSQLLDCFAPCHGCIDSAVHSTTGPELREECAKITESQQTEEPTGQAKITNAYNLPCRHVPHAVDPIIGWSLTDNDYEQSKSCYRSCMDLADEHHLESIAFCCISIGEFHLPDDKAVEITVQTAETCLETSSVRRITLNVFKDNDFHIYESLFRQNSNLQDMRTFYQTYEKCQTLSGKLSWSHYREPLSIKDTQQTQADNYNR